MEQYGYLYNQLLKDVRQFSTKPELNIKAKSNHYIYLIVSCIVLMFLIYKYCL